VRPKAPPFPITPVAEAMPFKTMAMDLITDLPVSDGFDSIFTITDHNATKATIFIPCSKTIDALNAAQLYCQGSTGPCAQCEQVWFNQDNLARPDQD
jgi:hypothetical protein